MGGGGRAVVTGAESVHVRLVSAVAQLPPPVKQLGERERVKVGLGLAGRAGGGGRRDGGGRDGQNWAGGGELGRARGLVRQREAPAV